MTWQPGTFHLEAAGHRLEARMIGPAPDARPTIVMLHEGLGSAGLWRDVPDRLAERTGWGVVAYSRAGYGRSSPKPLPWSVRYMHEEALEVLPAVLDAIGLRSGILLGHSDGASIAAIYAGSVQDHRIRGVTLVAPHFFTEPAGLAAIEAAATAYETGDLRTRMARHHDDPDNAFFGWNRSWMNPDFHDWDISEVIGYLRVPVLAIQGEDDQYGTLAQLDALETGLYSPFEKLVLSGCGHAPHLERPDDAISAIADFVARLERIEAEPSSARGPVASAGR